MQGRAEGTQTESATPYEDKKLRFSELVAGAGFEPKSPSAADCADSQHKDAKPSQNQAPTDSAQQPPEQNPALSEHPEYSSPHAECAIGVQQNQPAMPADLADVVEAWGRLSEAVRAGILAMVKASKGE